MSLLSSYVDPYTTPFERWAAELCEQLASYNPPYPGPEAAWVSWAEQLSALPALSTLATPLPRSFSSWRVWGAALMQVAA